MIKFNVKKGMSGVAQMTVRQDNMAERYYQPMPPSFATPMLVSLMDNAAIEAVRDFLPQGYITVASSIKIKHLAPTPEGMVVTSQAELIDIYQNRLIFKVIAYDEVEKIGEGEVERYIVELENITKKILDKKKK